MSRVLAGDATSALSMVSDGSVHAVVTDPPYGLSEPPNIGLVLDHWLAGDDYQHRGGGFMGKSWDAFVPGPSVWREAARVTQPDGVALVFAGTRSLDLMCTAMRLGSWSIGGVTGWTYGQGMPKSLNVGKAVAARAAKTGRNVAGAAWEGWNTGLKPAWEPIVVAHRPGGESAAAAVLDRLRFGVYAAKAASRERVGVWIPGCACFGDPHDPHRDGPPLAADREQACEVCGLSWVKYTHPTVKPVALMASLVEAVSEPGDVVLDLFAGTGSTGVAAAETGREALLVERDPVHVEICRIRLDGAVGGAIVVSAAEPNTAAVSAEPVQETLF